MTRQRARCPDAGGAVPGTELTGVARAVRRPPAAHRRRFPYHAAALALLSACTTTAPTPYPCNRIDEVPGLREEMAALRGGDDLRQQLRLAPVSALVRAYARDASVACAYDREIGAPEPRGLLDPKRAAERPAWWKRWRESLIRWLDD